MALGMPNTKLSAVVGMLAANPGMGIYTSALAIMNAVQDANLAYKDDICEAL